MIHRRGPVLAAPGGVQVVHRGRHVVGVPVARAEDDRLLLRPAGREQMREQVLAHRDDPIGEQDAVLKGGALVQGAQLAGRHGLSGDRVDRVPR